MKKIVALTSNTDFIETIIQKRRHNQEIIHCDDLGFLNDYNVSSFDYIVVDVTLFSNIYPWEWLNGLKSYDKPATLCIPYNHYDSSLLDIVLRMSADMNYTVEFIDKSLDATLIYILESINEEPKFEHNGHQVGKVMTCVGSSSKDGTSTICANVAVELANTLANSKVCLLDLNLKSPSQHRIFSIKRNEEQLMRMRTRWDSGLLNTPLLRESLVGVKKLKNLFVLPGISKVDLFQDLTVEQVYVLIQLCIKEFDYVIIDAGNVPDNAATYAAMVNADFPVMIINPQDETSVESYVNWYSFFWKTVLNKELIIAFNQSQNYGEVELDITSMELKGPHVSIPFHIKKDDKLIEFAKKQFVMEDNTLFKQAIGELIHHIDDTYEVVKYEPTPQKNNWRWRKWS